MPTTNSEANQIIKISQEYIQLDKLRELFIRLDKEVGQNSTNDSLKTSLTMMRMLVDPPMPPAPFLLKIAFYLLVIVHFILVCAISLSFLILPFYADWYVAVPCMAFIFFFATTRVDCQLTNLENKIRVRLGKKRIGGFIGFYMFKPLKRILEHFKRT